MPETTLTEPLVVCPFFVAVTVYAPVSVTVKTAVPLLVFVAIVVPPFFSVTDAPESTLTVIVAERTSAPPRSYLRRRRFSCRTFAR